MTEAEWETCKDPFGELLDLLHSATERKRTLFACACFRAKWASIKHQPTANAVDVIERHLDGTATTPEREVAATAASWAVGHSGGDVQVYFVARAVATVAAEKKAAWSDVAYLYYPAQIPVNRLLDIFGKPCSTACVPPGNVLLRSLAQAAYSERLLPIGHLDAARLAILSDALEEAGCTDDTILSHLRSPGPHVRGCWALDLILGK